MKLWRTMQGTIHVVAATQEEAQEALGAPMEIVDEDMNIRRDFGGAFRLATLSPGVDYPPKSRVNHLTGKVTAPAKDWATISSCVKVLTATEELS